MLIKASQRGGGKQLALHLLNAQDNEHVKLHSLRGFASDDLVSAMKEAYAVSKGTRCRQFLFSVSLNPPERENVPVETFEDALARIEKRTGLEGQPRAIVFHEKEGRRHCHAVYSRIDAESMRAVNLSHFKLKLRDISKQLYLENDWQLPKGYIDSRAKDPRTYSLAEYQQAKRLGREASDLKALMTECWAASDGAAAFTHALRERGFTLARGDRRGHVAITPEGEVLSVARYTGKKTKDIRARLGEPDGLPSVDEAKRTAARDMDSAMQRHLAEARELHRKRMAPLETRRHAMTAEHRAERHTLAKGQERRWQEEARQRSQRLNTGLRGLWDRLTGRHERVRQQNLAEAHAALLRDRQQRQALIEAQLGERRQLQTEIKAARLAQAELLRDLHRDRQALRNVFEAQSSPRQSRVDKPRETGPTVRREFDQAARASKTPTSHERLRHLRDQESRSRRRNDRGREP